MKLEFTQEMLTAAVRLPASPRGMSNLYRVVDEDLEVDLRAGKQGGHAGRDHWGRVWYDPESGQFCEQVLVYQQTRAVYRAATLAELMTEVNDEFGWE